MLTVRATNYIFLFFMPMLEFEPPLILVFFMPELEFEPPLILVFFMPELLLVDIPELLFEDIVPPPVLEPIVLLLLVVVVVVVLDVVFILPVFVLSVAQPVQKAATASKAKRAKVLRIEFSPVTLRVSLL
jgi:hypothetical protein